MSADREDTEALDLAPPFQQRAWVSVVGALVIAVVWTAIGPAVIAEVRQIVSVVSAWSVVDQDRAIAVVVGALLIGRCLTRMTRRRPRGSAAAAGRPSVAVAAGAVDEQVARHEAAHAVVVHELGGMLLHVRAVPNGQSAGRCTWLNDISANADATASAWRELCYSLAGSVACPDGRAAWPGSRDDTASAVAEAAFIATRGQRPAGYDGPLSVDGLLVGARARVAAVLAERAGSLDALTGALIAHGALDGEDAVAILTRAAPTSESPGAARYDISASLPG